MSDEQFPPGRAHHAGTAVRHPVPARPPVPIPVTPLITGQGSGTRPAARAATQRGAAPPPRPPVTSGLLPLPVERQHGRSRRAVRAPGVLWGAACLVGAAALTSAATDRHGLRRSLAAAARRADPGAAASVVDRGVALTVGLAGAATVLLLLIAGAVLPAVLRGGRRARWALVVTGALWVPVLVLDQSLVAGGGSAGRPAFLLQGALVVAALGALLLPAARRSSGRAGR